MYKYKETTQVTVQLPIPLLFFVKHLPESLYSLQITTDVNNIAPSDPEMFWGSLGDVGGDRKREEDEAAGRLVEGFSYAKRAVGVFLVDKAVKFSAKQNI